MLKRKYAFTLVELLVVVTIIALLVAILIPTLQDARRASQSAACLNNLRQIGVGVRLYAIESNNVALPYTAPNNYTWKDYNGNPHTTDEYHWQHFPLFRQAMGVPDVEALAVEPGNDLPKGAVWRRNMICPNSYNAMQNSGTYLSLVPSYGYNHEHSRRPTYSAPFNTAYIMLTNVNNAYQKILIADGLHWEMVGDGKCDWYIDEYTADHSNWNGVAAYRHGPQCGSSSSPARLKEWMNVLFFDFHAEPLTRQKATQKANPTDNDDVRLNRYWLYAK